MIYFPKLMPLSTGSITITSELDHSDRELCVVLCVSSIPGRPRIATTASPVYSILLYSVILLILICIRVGNLEMRDSYRYSSI